MKLGHQCIKNVQLFSKLALDVCLGFFFGLFLEMFFYAQTERKTYNY